MPRPHGTYSIVAFDPMSGEHGVAVQSHWFSVGSMCPWARPGVGAVATQSIAEPGFGPAASSAIAAGADADGALAAVLAGDELTAMRQVGIIGARQRRGAHRGRLHPRGRTRRRRALVVSGQHDGDGGSPGGDVGCVRHGAGRPRRTPRRRARRRRGCRRRRARPAVRRPPRRPAEGEPWRTRVDLRVEDHADPIGEMRRLLALQAPYALAGEGDELMAAGRADEAAAKYVRGRARPGFGRAGVLGRPGDRPGGRRRRGCGGGAPGGRGATPAG